MEQSRASKVDSRSADHFTPGSFQGVKWPGRGDDHPHPSSVEVKERVELYLYSPSGPSCPILDQLYLYLYLCLK